MRSLQRYELDERIGVGGLAEVFRGTGVSRDGERRPVLVKRLREDFSRDREYVARFWNEARTASILQHPNVVELLDAGTIGGRLFLAWDYVDGADLSRIVARVKESRRRLTVGATLHLVNEILKGLDHVHTREDENGEPLNIVHRELSPETVVVSREGDVKLADVGLARATIRAGKVISGAIQGDAHYMSPEQLAGTRVDKRADLYAAGMILFTLLAGEHPLGALPMASLLPQILAGKIPSLAKLRPDLPPKLAEATMKAIAAAPGNRYSSAQEFQIALLEYASDRKIRLEGRKLADFLAVHFPGGSLAPAPVPALPAEEFHPFVIEARGAEEMPVSEDSVVRTPMKSSVFAVLTPVEEAPPSKVTSLPVAPGDEMRVRAARRRPTVIRTRGELGDTSDPEAEAPEWQAPPAPLDADTAESPAPTRGGTRASAPTAMRGTTRGGGKNSTSPTATRASPPRTPAVTRPGTRRSAAPAPAKATAPAKGPPQVAASAVARAVPARPLRIARDAAKALWLSGHEGSVSAAAFLPDGQRAITGSADQTLIVWDLRRRRVERVLHGHKAAVTCVAVAAQGNIALSGSRDRTLIAWDLSSGLPISTCEGHKGWIFSVAVSVDGTRALSAGVETAIRLWDVPSGRTLGLLEGHEDGVSQVVFFPDGKRALSGGRDGTVRTWDTRARKEQRVVAREIGAVRTVAVSPDGTRALAAGAEPILRLYDLARGVEVHRFTGHRESIASAVFAPGGTRAISASYDGSIRVWDTVNGGEVQRWEGHVEPVLAVAISNDGMTALSAGADKRVGLWPVGRR